MPTVTELYQAVTTGAVLTVPNSNLKPERANSYELAAERRTGSNLVRLSLFEEDIGNALLSQSAPLLAGSTALFSYVQNVERTRAQGLELLLDQYDAFVPGLELMGSLTAVDAVQLHGCRRFGMEKGGGLNTNRDQSPRGPF